MMKILLQLALVAIFAMPIAAIGGPVDVNSADAATISAELKGIGMTKAKAIVEYREKHGPFKSPEDLSLVKGIGERTVELNRDDIRVKPVSKK
jgi:competence protein ComEA